jgi:hypothetical protein
MSYRARTYKIINGNKYYSLDIHAIEYAVGAGATITHHLVATAGSDGVIIEVLSGSICVNYKEVERSGSDTYDIVEDSSWSSGSPAMTFEGGIDPATEASINVEKNGVKYGLYSPELPVLASNVSGSNTGDQDLSGKLDTDQTTQQTTAGTFKFPKIEIGGAVAGEEVLAVKGASRSYTCGDPSSGNISASIISGSYHVLYDPSDNGSAVSYMSGTFNNQSFDFTIYAYRNVNGAFVINATPIYLTLSDYSSTDFGFNLSWNDSGGDPSGPDGFLIYSYDGVTTLWTDATYTTSYYISDFSGWTDVNSSNPLSNSYTSPYYEAPSDTYLYGLNSYGVWGKKTTEGVAVYSANPIYYYGTGDEYGYWKYSMELSADAGFDSYIVHNITGGYWTEALPGSSYATIIDDGGYNNIWNSGTPTTSPAPYVEGDDIATYKNDIGRGYIVNGEGQIDMTGTTMTGLPFIKGLPDSTMVDNLNAQFWANRQYADIFYALDVWNPMSDYFSHPDFTLSRVIWSPVVAASFFKKYANTITLGSQNNWNNLITVYQSVNAAGALKLGVSQAFQNGIIYAVASSWNMSLDLNGLSNSMDTPATATPSAYNITNTSASVATLTLSGSGSKSPAMAFKKPVGSGGINILTTGSTSITWSGVASYDNNWGNYTIGSGCTVVDNNGALLSKAVLIMMTGASSTLTLSNIDHSSKLRWVNSSTPVIRNNTQNCTLGTAFGNQESGSASTAAPTFNGAGATYATTLSGNNTWSGSTTLGPNAYVKLGHANSLGTSLGLAFATGPWRIDNVTGAPLTLTKNPTFLQANTLTYDGSNTLSFSGAGTLGGALGLTVSASKLSFDGNLTGAYAINKTGAGDVYVKQTAGAFNLVGGPGSCQSMTSLALTNTVGVVFTAINHATNGIVSACTTASFGLATRVAFSWVAGSSRFTYITASSTVSLGTCGLNFSGAPNNGVYDIIVATGVMSGTLPTVASNTTGKTLVLSQVGNTLKVTVS